MLTRLIPLSNTPVDRNTGAMFTIGEFSRATHLSVKEISASTGYEHVPSFDRKFRNHFKMTPGEFRKGMRV